MSARFTSTYDTQDELNYIRGIGSFRVVGKQKFTRQQLLEIYKKTLEKRCEWGKIDRTIVMNCIDSELQTLNTEEKKG